MDVHAIMQEKNQRTNHWYREEQQLRKATAVERSAVGDILNGNVDDEERASGEQLDSPHSARRGEWRKKDEEERENRQRTLSTLLLPLIYRHELRGALKNYSAAVEVNI
tara:strand:- start:43 stop:369 length:327 start_codon:yes stop_codon:yes gene_type:complete